MEATERTGRDPSVLAAGAAVVLAQYHFFIRGNRELGLFVGLWPPTILAFASYFNDRRILQRLSSGPASGIRESVERMVRGR